MPLFSIQQFVPFALVVCAGIFTQSATGFAGGLVIIPLMLWAGHGVPEAQTAMLCATMPQNLLGVYRFRETIELRQLALPAALRIFAFPIGIAALYVVDDFPVTLVRQIVGVIVIGCVLLLLLLKPSPRHHLPQGWTWLAFLTSGFFAGMTGTGGPMMVLWVQAHDWSTRKVRSFLFIMYLMATPILLGLLYMTFRERVVRAFCSACLLIPVVLPVAHMGLHFGSRLGRNRLRRITFAMLLLIGILGLLAPLLSRNG